MKIYNKLVRDKITNIIEAEGRIVKYRILDNNEYKQELNKKLQEELDVWKNYYDTAHHNAHTLNVENKQLKKDLEDMKMKLQDYEHKMKHFM